MNIHEFQAKELFDRFQVPSPKGKVASTPKEAHDAAKWLGVNSLVVKAQVHAGGRGKGVFKNGFKGGVHLVESADAARDVATQMLGETLVTKQTGDEGRLVRKVMIAESVSTKKKIKQQTGQRKRQHTGTRDDYVSQRFRKTKRGRRVSKAEE